MNNPDTCPECGRNTMPAIPPDSKATARCCQNPECGHIQELPLSPPVPGPGIRRMDL